MPEQKGKFSSIGDLPDAKWQDLSQKKIYFGHQSVGSNIIDGIKDVMKDNSHIRLNIVETISMSDFTQGIFAHSTVGYNTEPQSKHDAFVANLKNGIGGKADAVLLKFCYVDFNPWTDVPKMFERYKLAMEDIKKDFRSLIVMHMTVPLLKIQTGPKAWVKRVIGRPIDGINDNMKRLEYNELLVNEYGGKDPIFDLSKIESTYPDGKRETFIKEGKTYYAMVPAYTDDGGHLNDMGKRVVAEQLLLFLLTTL